MVEMIDIFDENYTYIGCAEKSVAHKFGLWHQTFQCWIIRRRDNNNYILFQKRANQKKIHQVFLIYQQQGIFKLERKKKMV